MSTLAPDQGGAPAPMSGRALRKLTRSYANSDGGASVMSVVGDIYTATSSLIISILLIAGVASGLGLVWSDDPTGQAAPPAVVGWLALVLLAAGVGSLAGRLGPVGVDTAELLWWFGSPVERRGLLRPRLWQAAGLAALVLAVAWPMALLTDGADLDLAGYAALAVAGMGFGLGLVAALTAAEKAAPVRQALVLACDGLLFASPIAAFAAAAAGAPVPSAGAPSWFASLAVLALGLVAVLAADQHLGSLRVAVLHRLGSAMGAAATAVRSLDTRELSAALQDAVATHRPHARSPLLEAARGPFSAMVVGDAIAFIRAPRRWLQLFVAACITLLIALLALQLTLVPGRLAIGLGVLIGGSMAAVTTVETARQAFRSPALDALVPMGARWIRLARGVVPTCLLLAWGWAVGAALTSIVVLPGLTPIVMLAAPTLAAAALRSAYRQPPDWSGPLLITPQGAFPPAMFSVFKAGPDLAVPGLIPVFLALLPGANLAVAAVLQALAAGVACYLTTRNPPRASD